MCRRHGRLSLILNGQDGLKAEIRKNLIDNLLLLKIAHDVMLLNIETTIVQLPVKYQYLLF
jgi:hypothetical protein